MGLFDSLKGQREVVLSPRAAMLLACISMVAADGVIDDEEMDIIQRIDGKQVTPDWNQAVQAWKRLRGPRDCVDLVVPRLDEVQKMFTMANLVDIAMADGVLAGSEQALLEEYVGAFGLDEEFVMKVVEVIGVKNDRGPFE